MRILMDEARQFMGGIQSVVAAEKVQVFDKKRPIGEEGPQDHNADGVPLWMLHAVHLVGGPFGAEMTQIKIKVALEAAPKIPEGGTAATFQGLWMNLNPRNQGGWSLSFSADGVEFASDETPASRTKAKASEQIPTAS